MLKQSVIIVLASASLVSFGGASAAETMYESIPGPVTFGDTHGIEAPRVVQASPGAEGRRAPTSLEDKASTNQKQEPKARDASNTGWFFEPLNP